MARITAHAGDFGKGAGEFFFGSVSLPKGKFQLTELSEVEVATEEAVKRAGGTVGWGAAGLVVLGPVGLLAGLLLGGKGKDVTFVAKFKDGRKLLATTDSKSFIKIKAAVF